MDFRNLEESIGYYFKDEAILKKALTHTSYAYENKIESNEKLEFLGDSIYQVNIYMISIQSLKKEKWLKLELQLFVRIVCIK